MSLIKFNKEKAKSALLYLLQNLNDNRRDIHSVFKALYFAEKEHLGQYGRTIVGDSFIAMNFGPVPSKIYDWTENSWEMSEPIEGSIEMTSKIQMKPIEEPDLSALSESDINALNEGIKLVNDANFDMRTAMSHDEAYKSTRLNKSMDYMKIAKEGGASEEMIEYIQNRLEISNTFC